MKNLSETIDKTMDNIEKSFDNLSDEIYKRLDNEVADAEKVKIIQVGNGGRDFSLLDRLLYFAVGFAAGFLVYQYIIM